MRKSLFTFFVLLILVMTGCSDEETGTNHGGSDNGFNLSYTVTAPVSVLTRSAIDLEDGEDRITSFYVLFFENTSGRTGRFLEAIDVMESHSGPVASSGNVAVTFPEGSSLNNASEYKMLVCANIEEYTDMDGLEDLITFCDGKTEREVTYLLHTITGVTPGEGEEDDDTNRMPSDNLPMSTSLVKPADATLLTVELDRTVARFDVFCEAGDYELVSASIWNAYTESDVWEGNFSDFSAPRTERYYGVKADSNKEIKGNLYAFQNYVAEPEQNDKVTTCLIIGLKKTGTQAVEYFRTNVNASGSLGQQLKRNTAYRTIVKDVLNKGSETERGAYENEQLLLDIDVEGWKVDESGTIQIEGGNVLAMPTSTVRLFAQGETREYYVYTIGEGMPKVTVEELPDNIEVTLKLAPGYSENADFKKSILTFTATKGKTLNNNYKIEIGFLTMSAPIKVEQVEGNIDFIDLESYEEIELGEKAGSVTDEITVNSSGTWVAEIVRGDHLSFTSSGNQQTKTEGAPGEGFKVYAHELNSADEPLYWFVSVYLKEKPEVIRNLVISQKGGADPRYVRFSQREIIAPTGGGYTDYFTIETNSTWSALLIIEEGTTAGINNTTTQTIANTSQNRTVRIYMPAHYGKTPTRVILRAQVKDSENSADLVIYQKPYYTGALVVTTAEGVSNLQDQTHNNYKNYVYNLGENMRNTSLFGPDGGFDFKTTTVVAAMAEASIIQLVATNSTVFNNAYAKYQEDSAKLLMFSSNSATTTNNLLTSFRSKQTTGYVANSIVSVSNSSANYREFYQEDNMDHPLIKYLLNGPAGVANPDEIQLQGYSTAGGIKEGNWPSTFIPIIKSVVSQTTYCVFGIDPVNRLIFIMDPAIFGAISTASSSYPNRENYVESKASNINFLNNFIAWMAQVATEGESFLQQFQ